MKAISGDTTLREAAMALADEISNGRNSLQIVMNLRGETATLELRAIDVVGTNVADIFPKNCPKCGHSTGVYARDPQWKPHCLNCNHRL